MSVSSQFTLLETLLLSRSLAVHGADPSAFSRISDGLKQNALLRQQGAYDADRLEPGALRDVYTALLEDERNRRFPPESGDEVIRFSTEDYRVHPTSRKRKSPSPALKNTSVSSRDPSTLARIADRLYVEYKDHVIDQIRGDEKHIQELQQEILEIESGDWDQRLLDESIVSSVPNLPTLSRSPPATSSTQLEAQDAKVESPRTPTNSQGPATQTGHILQRPQGPLNSFEPKTVEQRRLHADQLPLRITTPGSSTRWKPPDDGVIQRPPDTPIEPPYSPLSEADESFPPEASYKHARSSGPSELSNTPGRVMSDPQAEAARGTSRKSSLHSRHGAYPAARDSASLQTRSQSLISREVSPSATDALNLKNVKEEEPSTPTVGGALPMARRPQYFDTAGDDRSLAAREYELRGRRKRKRSSRDPSLSTEDFDSIRGRSTSEFDGIPLVLATRNFPRTSAPLLNDVSAHKFASLFAGPVKEKDVPGYRDVIYRPQDLKSIKAALTQGAKAVNSYVGSSVAASTPNAAAEASMSGSPGQSSIAATGGPMSTSSASKSNTTFWVPAHESVVPPKGIVNSAQLEKELMRMFANAVMFNPDPDRGFGPSFGRRRRRRQNEATKTRKDNDDDRGEEEDDDGEPDLPPYPTTDDDDDGDESEAEEGGANNNDDDGGVVKDTRDMFESVQRSVAGWRAAERATIAGMEAEIVRPGSSGRFHRSKGNEGQDRPGPSAGDDEREDAGS
ncbi:MAG: hypothetical protein M1815_001874 [Lichina confinis]|nr:MAG: hypothetical protein M1815_001874 [Lichina confinis]